MVAIIIAAAFVFMPAGEPVSPASQVSYESVSGGSDELISQGSDELVAAVGTHGGEPEAGFNPITGWGYNREPLVQSTLFKKDSNANLINDLATDYTVSRMG